MDPLLTDIYHQLPAPIIICSAEQYKVEYLNAAAEKAWKRSSVSILQKPLNLAFPELNQSTILEKLDRLLGNNQPFAIPQIQIKNDFSTSDDTYLSLDFQPLRLAGNVRLGFTVTVTDITELVAARRAAEQLQKTAGLNNAMLNAHHEATPFAVLIVDAKGGIISFTKKFIELWQMPEHVVQSGNDVAALEFAMTQVADPEGFISKVRHLYLHPEETNYDEILFKDGRIIERYGKTVIGEDGTYYGWAWHFRDISHLKLAAAELKQKNKELEVLLTEFQFVTDTIPQLAWATEPDGATTFFNKGWREYTGLDVEALLGDGWLQSIHPDDAPRTLNA